MDYDKILVLDEGKVAEYDLISTWLIQIRYPIAITGEERDLLWDGCGKWRVRCID